jgi:hypothetical protein
MAPKLGLTWSIPADHRRLVLVAAGSLLALVVVAVATWVWWPEPEPERAPRARQYLDFTACLLTDDKGVVSAAAAPVWAGMQQASQATRAKVQYLAVAGPQTVANAAPFLASQAQGRCQVLFAVGTAPAAAVQRDAKRFPKARFYLVGDTSAGVSTIDAGAPAAVRAEVAKLVTAAVTRSNGR